MVCIKDFIYNNLFIFFSVIDLFNLFSVCSGVSVRCYSYKVMALVYRSFSSMGKECFSSVLCIMAGMLIDITCT